MKPQCVLCRIEDDHRVLVVLRPADWYDRLFRAGLVDGSLDKIRGHNPPHPGHRSRQARMAVANIKTTIA